MIKILSNLEHIDKVSTKIILLMKEYNFNFITFSGDVGSGKTSLIRNLLQNFNIAHNEITSPTFNLLNIYHFNNNKDQTYMSEGRIDDNSDGSFKNGDCIWHYDLYRLNTPTEIFNLDFDESLIQYLTLVEYQKLLMITYLKIE